jgi:hypothetical protein
MNRVNKYSIIAFTGWLFSLLLISFSIGHDKPPQSWPCRLVYITASLMFLILFIAYSAIFISILTVHHYKMPFVDFQGLLDSGTHRLVVADKPVYVSFFKVRKISLC